MDNKIKVLIILIALMIIGAILYGLSFDLKIVTLGFVDMTILIIGSIYLYCICQKFLINKKRILI